MTSSSPNNLSFVKITRIEIPVVPGRMDPQEVANAFEENGDAMGYTTYDGEDAPRSRVISPINTTFSGNIRVCNGTVFTRDVMGCDGLAINFVSTANFQQGLNTDTIAPFSSNTVVVNGALDAYKVSTNEVHTDNIYPETSNVVTVHGGLEADFISANTIYANNIQAPGGGPVTTDNFDVHILTVDEIYSTDDLEVHSNTVFDRDVRICGGILRVSDIEPCGASLHIGGNVSFDNIHFGTLSANNFVANSITTQSATIQNLTSNVIHTNLIVSNIVTTTNFASQNATIQNLVSNSIQTNSVTTVNLASQNASIQNLVSNAISTNAITTLNLIAQNANITDLTVTNLHVQQINLQDATIINLHVQNLDTQNLEAQIANLIYLNVQEIDVSVLNAQDAQIQNLEAQSANLVQANILDLTVDNLHVIQTAYLQNATVQNLVGQVANFVQANITDLIAINVDADSVSTEVLTAFAADVVTINVQELDAQVANIDELTVNTLHVQNIELQSANIVDLTVQNLDAQVANLVQATIANIVSVDITTTNLIAQNANLNHIVAIDVTAQVANFVQVTTDNLDANFALIDVLVTNVFSANAASIDVLQVQTIGNPDGELVFTSDSSFCGVNLVVSNLVACSPNGTINVNDNLVLSKNLVVNGTITTTGPPSIPFVGARVLLSSDQTLGIATTVTNVAFDTVDYDTNSMWNNTTKAFLLPYNGYYEVLSSLGSSATVSIGALREIDLMKNGTAVPGTQDSSPLTIGLLTSGSSSMKIADTIRCNAGDTLYIQYSGVSLDVLGADGSAFSIKLVGTF